MTDNHQPPANQGQRIPLQITEIAKNPIYANAMQISHTRDEFLLDFIKMFPPTATLNARIVVTPGHMKRLIKAMQENLDRYENSFGEIKIAEAPSKEIGFSGRES